MTEDAAAMKVLVLIQDAYDPPVPDTQCVKHLYVEPSKLICPDNNHVLLVFVPQMGTIDVAAMG
jgi:hypothetical protein